MTVGVHMDATRQAVSGLLIALFLITAPVSGAGQTPATSASAPAIHEAPACTAGQVPATGQTSPQSQETRAADLLADHALPLPTGELGQVSGGALNLVSPEQLQQSAAGVKLWDEVRIIRPAGTVELGSGQTGQIMSNVSAQQTVYH